MSSCTHAQRTQRDRSRRTHGTGLPRDSVSAVFNDWLERMDGRWSRDTEGRNQTEAEAVAVWPARSYIAACRMVASQSGCRRPAVTGSRMRSCGFLLTPRRPQRRTARKGPRLLWAPLAHRCRRRCAVGTSRGPYGSARTPTGRSSSGLVGTKIACSRPGAGYRASDFQS